MLKRSVWHLVPLSFLLLATFPLSGCGNNCPDRPSGPATRANDPISIMTDHSVYAPDQLVNVTFVNHLSSAVQSAPAWSGCQVEIIMQQDHSVGNDVAACGSPKADQGPSRRPIQIAPGQTAEASAYISDNASAGTYHVLFQYITLPIPPPTPSNYRLQYIPVYSATFQVCA